MVPEHQIFPRFCGKTHEKADREKTYGSERLNIRDFD
jgi:hypothetical protein